jgi:hypothetical protein
MLEHEARWPARDKGRLIATRWHAYPRRPRPRASRAVITIFQIVEVV